MASPLHCKLEDEEEPEDYDEEVRCAFQPLALATLTKNVFYEADNSDSMAIQVLYEENEK